MSHIDHPPYNRELAANRLAFGREALPRFLKGARAGDARRIEQVAEAGWELACNLSLLEPESPEVLPAVRTAAQAHALAFAQVSAAPGTTVTLPLGEGPPVTLPARRPHEFTNAETWCRGFYLAALGRDIDSLNSLCATPLDVLRQAGLWTLECVHQQAAALQSYRLGREDLADRLVEALRSTDAGRVRAEAPPPHQEGLVKHALRVVFPELQLLVRLVEGDAERFNAALAEALTLHKQHWWEQDQARNSQGSRHFLALGPLALASFATANGIPVTVTSPYLPRRLYAPNA